MRGIYPPAGWFADGVVDANLPRYLGFTIGSIALFLLAATLVGRRYAAVCAMLSARRSGRGFRMTAQRGADVRFALYRRELRRYFASPIYVLNTVVGPILAVVLSGALLFSGVGTFLTEFPIPIALAPRMVAFLLGLLLAMSPTTASSVSMEGRQWRLLKSLPIHTAAVAQGKLLVNFTIAAPAWALSSALAIIALRPEGGALVWLILMPAACVLFSTLLGLGLNLAFPSFGWENETTPVKQGKPVLFCMLAALLCSMLPAAATALLPARYADALGALVFALLIVASALLYRSIIRLDLRSLD